MCRSLQRKNDRTHKNRQIASICSLRYPVPQPSIKIAHSRLSLTGFPFTWALQLSFSGITAPQPCTAKMVFLFDPLPPDKQPFHSLRVVALGNCAYSIFIFGSIIHPISRFVKRFVSYLQIYRMHKSAYCQFVNNFL